MEKIIFSERTTIALDTSPFIKLNIISLKILKQISWQQVKSFFTPEKNRLLDVLINEYGEETFSQTCRLWGFSLKYLT